MSMIQQIPGAAAAAALSSMTVSGAKGPQDVPQSENTAAASARKPVTDEYIPEEKQEPAGLYRLGRDEDGQPKIYFDDPQRCTCSTDQVDHEIEQLKKELTELTRQISVQTDETAIRELEQKLTQVEQELSQKDNDTYRRQHAVFS